MKIVFIGFIMCFIGFNAALASTITVTKDIHLSEWDSAADQYWVFSNFEEQNPGILSKNVNNNGCNVIIYSKEQKLPKGTYSIIEEETSSPDFWDSRWLRSIRLSLLNGEFSITCKTNVISFTNPIDDEYINSVSNGYLVYK